MTTHDQPIVIVPYRPTWPEEFRQVATPIRAALGDRALRVDHIGSTSIPNLAAKDVIDVQVTVADLDPPQPIVETLTGLGYTWLDHITGDHIPPGSDIPPERMRKIYFNRRNTLPQINLHVRMSGTPNQRYPLLFRDYLRAHPLAAAAYAEVKRQLAAHAPTDWDLYYDIKDPICDIIMAAADDWATTVRWSPSNA
jgi:GrpB-like predicted nucleotidyltransferase (UPF0157 family)